MFIELGFSILLSKPSLEFEYSVVIPTKSINEKPFPNLVFLIFQKHLFVFPTHDTHPMGTHYHTPLFFHETCFEWRSLGLA